MNATETAERLIDKNADEVKWHPVTEDDIHHGMQGQVTQELLTAVDALQIRRLMLDLQRAGLCFDMPGVKLEMTCTGVFVYRWWNLAKEDEQPEVAFAFHTRGERVLRLLVDFPVVGVHVRIEQPTGLGWEPVVKAISGINATGVMV